MLGQGDARGCVSSAMGLEEQLADFAELNPLSETKEAENGFRVVKPWGDETIALQVEEPCVQEMIDALNRIVLPPRFSAVYHTETRRIEFIWSFLPPEQEIIGRQFTFTLASEEFNCEFADASSELLMLARHFVPIAPPRGTNYRNLHTLTRPSGEHLPREVADFVDKLRPVSFWVGPLDAFDEGHMVWVAKHLNLYMHYYDRRSPVIMVHSSDQPEAPYEPLQQIQGVFPPQIASRHIDAFLLELLGAAREVAESRLKFIYYFQVLEHASFYVVDDVVRRDMIRILRSPDLQANAEEYLPRILETVADLRIADEHRLMRVVQTRASADDLWAEIEDNLAYFATQQVFDGGFVIDPLVSTDTTLEAFRTMWQPKVCDNLRWIRNALVHARESRGKAVISPTAANDRMLWPWVWVIRRIAENVVIYGD